MNNKKDNLKKAAKFALVILLVDVVAQLLAVFQTKHELISPVIPETLIWEISKQLVFHAMVFAIASIAGLILYFFEKYLLVVILAVLVCIIDRFLYL